MNRWTHLTFTGLLLAPWTALVAIVRQKEAFARDQKLTFALERSELERQALDARLYRLQVDAGSPHASAVLRSLTTYLRAAVPLLHAKLRSGGGKHEALRWIRAQAGRTVRLSAVDDVDYLRSDAKYTTVGAKAAEAVVRTPTQGAARAALC
jgi:hypothetical protein